MPGKAANEISGAGCSEREHRVAIGVCRDGAGGGARVIVRLCYLKNVVLGRIIVEN